MKRYLAAAATFFSIHIAIGWVLWLGGFDFDNRNPLIAYCGGIALFFGSFAAFSVFTSIEKGPTP